MSLRSLLIKMKLYIINYKSIIVDLINRSVAGVSFQGLNMNVCLYLCVFGVAFAAPSSKTKQPAGMICQFILPFLFCFIPVQDIHEPGK